MPTYPPTTPAYPPTHTWIVLCFTCLKQHPFWCKAYGDRVNLRCIAAYPAPPTELCAHYAMSGTAVA
eukprot:1278453-Rhodomonas_salina.1